MSSNAGARSDERASAIPSRNAMQIMNYFDLGALPCVDTAK
jgi:hypothetical protein